MLTSLLRHVPIDVIRHIVSMLDLCDLVNFSQTSKTANQIFKEENFWKRHVLPKCSKSQLVRYKLLQSYDLVPKLVFTLDATSARLELSGSTLQRIEFCIVWILDTCYKEERCCPNKFVSTMSSTGLLNFSVSHPVPTDDVILDTVRDLADYSMEVLCDKIEKYIEKFHWSTCIIHCGVDDLSYYTNIYEQSFYFEEEDPEDIKKELFSDLECNLKSSNNYD